ncbi:MAG: hypothetical protein L6R28_10310 [Planctomycetes bacterium]|nr:hypothetical protein [Planctomycetota bacterium]
MNRELVTKLLNELRQMPIYDAHTHVMADRPVASHLGDLLGYHYFTELSNSSRGRPVPLPEDPGARIDYVWPHLPQLKGTIQLDWMLGISEAFLGIPRGDWWTKSQKQITERANAAITAKDYCAKVWERSNIKKAYMTNQFDEDLSKHGDARLVPCLRTDDLVFNVDSANGIKRLETCTGETIGENAQAFDRAVAKIFDRFAKWKMGYAALGLPPSFVPDEDVSTTAAGQVLKHAARGEKLTPEGKKVWASFMLDRISAHCARVKAPFCLMPGADRGVYAHGVPSGQDLFRCDGHLRGYDAMLNKYSDVRYPIMVVSDTAGLELVAQGWIRHNVYVFSHWWYANNPADIRRELRRRLDVLPRNKFIGFHSDGYWLEFLLPKFNTYRLQMAIVLAERIEESQVAPSDTLEPLDVQGALALAERVLLRNPDEIMGVK